MSNMQIGCVWLTASFVFALCPKAFAGNRLSAIMTPPAVSNYTQAMNMSGVGSGAMTGFGINYTISRISGASGRTYSIPDGVLLAGNLLSNKQKLVVAWIEIHHDDLLPDWKLAVNGKKTVSH